MIPRPETPPPSIHRLEIPVSPETPTPSPLHLHLDQSLSNPGGASLFDDDNKPIISQPSTPVLYNLIRNEGPPKFVIAAPQQVAKVAPPSVEKEIIEDDEESCIPRNRSN